jgi:hypothetical protein
MGQITLYYLLFSLCSVPIWVHEGELVNKGRNVLHGRGHWPFNYVTS